MQCFELRPEGIGGVYAGQRMKRLFAPRPRRIRLGYKTSPAPKAIKPRLPPRAARRQDQTCPVGQPQRGRQPRRQRRVAHPSGTATVCTENRPRPRAAPFRVLLPRPPRGGPGVGGQGVIAASQVWPEKTYRTPRPHRNTTKPSTPPGRRDPAPLAPLRGPRGWGSGGDRGPDARAKQNSPPCDGRRNHTAKTSGQTKVKSPCGHAEIMPAPVVRASKPKSLRDGSVARKSCSNKRVAGPRVLPYQEG